MTGRHRRRGRWRAVTVRIRPITEVVDARTLLRHRITDAAIAAGRRVGGHYMAMCGAEVLPAALTDPGRSGCPDCAGGLT